MTRPPLHYMLAGIMLANVALHAVTISQLDDARERRDGLELALVDKTLKHRALLEKTEYQARRLQAAEDLLRAARDQLALRDARHDSELVGIAIRGAEYYNTTTGQYAQAAQ